MTVDATVVCRAGRFLFLSFFIERNVSPPFRPGSYFCGNNNLIYMLLLSFSC